MALKSKSRNQGAGPGEEALKDAAQNARRSYAQAARAGQNLQEQAGLWWRAWLGSADWQKQAETISQMSRHTVPLAHRQVEHLMEFMDQSSRTTTELMKKAAEAVQAPLTGESQAAWVHLWTATAKAAQAQAEGLLEMGTRALDSWAEFARRSAEAAPRPNPAAA